VPGPDLIAALTQPIASAAPLFAYGPAPGVELIPYFLGLLAWVGLALGGLLLSPLSALLRLFRRTKATPQAGPPSEPNDTTAPESPGEGQHDRA
jgi:hypothetical protein